MLQALPERRNYSYVYNPSGCRECDESIRNIVPPWLNSACERIDWNPNDVTYYPLRRPRWERWELNPWIYNNALPLKPKWICELSCNSWQWQKSFPDYIDLFAPKGSPLLDTSVRYYPSRERLRSHDVPNVVHIFHHPPPEEKKEEIKKEPEVVAKKVDVVAKKTWRS